MMTLDKRLVHEHIVRMTDGSKWLWRHVHVLKLIYHFWSTVKNIKLSLGMHAIDNYFPPEFFVRKFGRLLQSAHLNDFK